MQRSPRPPSWILWGFTSKGKKGGKGRARKRRGGVKGRGKKERDRREKGKEWEGRQAPPLIKISGYYTENK